MRHRFVLILVVIAAVGFGGCRSRAKQTPAPAAAPQPVAQTIEAPRDFVSSSNPEPVRDELAGADINRLARERGWVRDAFFAFDSNTLDADARAALDASARWLRQNPNIRMVVEGHCDERGTEQYNLALGDRRAHAAREYLVALGVNPNRLSQISYGEERPFVRGWGEDVWKENRRAHLRLEK